MVNSEIGKLPWGSVVITPALCVPMHMGDIIGFKVIMSTSKSEKMYGSERGGGSG